MTTPEQRLTERGITLPPVPKPVAAYVPAVAIGNLAWTSGQLPMVNGRVEITGKLGLPVTEAQGYEAARMACLNAVAAVRSVAGSLDRVERVVSVYVFVQSADNFTEQPKVANGASDLLLEIFGDAGKHTRTAVGCNSLPLNASVEVALVVALHPAAA